MKKRKLKLKDGLINDLKEMRKALEDISIEKNDLKHISGGYCEGFCNVTCSYYCEDECAGSCKGQSQNGCAYKQVCVGAALPSPDPEPDN